MAISSCCLRRTNRNRVWIGGPFDPGSTSGRANALTNASPARCNGGGMGFGASTTATAVQTTMNRNEAAIHAARTPSDGQRAHASVKGSAVLFKGADVIAGSFGTVADATGATSGANAAGGLLSGVLATQACHPAFRFRYCDFGTNSRRAGSRI